MGARREASHGLIAASLAPSQCAGGPASSPWTPGRHDRAPLRARALPRPRCPRSWRPSRARQRRPCAPRQPHCPQAHAQVRPHTMCPQLPGRCQGSAIWSSRRPLPETREAYRRLVRCMPGGLQLIFAGTSTGSDRRRGREMPGPIRTRRWQDDGQNGGLQRDRANLSQTARSRSARARRRARDPRGGWAHHRTSAAGPFSLELGSAS